VGRGSRELSYSIIGLIKEKRGLTEIGEGKTHDSENALTHKDRPFGQISRKRRKTDWAARKQSADP